MPPGETTRAVNSGPDAGSDPDGARPRRAGRAVGSSTMASFLREPGWFKDAIVYETHVKAFFDSTGDGIGDLAGARGEARLPAGARHHLPLAAPLLPLPAPRRRLRHRRLPRRPPRLRDARPVQQAGRRGPPARDRGADRAGGQPHLGPAPVVPARARGAGRARPSAPGTSGATPTRSTRTRGSSSSTPSAPTGPGIPRPAPSTGTASSATSPTSTSTTRR